MTTTIKANTIYNSKGKTIGSIKGNFALINANQATNEDITELENKGYIIHYFL